MYRRGTSLIVLPALVRHDGAPVHCRSCTDGGPRGGKTSLLPSTCPHPEVPSDEGPHRDFNSDLPSWPVVPNLPRRPVRGPVRTKTRRVVGEVLLRLDPEITPRPVELRHHWTTGVHWVWGREHPGVSPGRTVDLWTKPGGPGSGREHPEGPIYPCLSVVTLSVRLFTRLRLPQQPRRPHLLSRSPPHHLPRLGGTRRETSSLRTRLQVFYLVYRHSPPEKIPLWCPRSSKSLECLPVRPPHTFRPPSDPREHLRLRSASSGVGVDLPGGRGPSGATTSPRRYTGPPPPLLNHTRSRR